MGILWPNLKALYYMTIHPALGILWQSPVLFLAILGAFFILRSRQYRAEGILSIWIIFSYFVVLSGYYMWWGGYALSSRFIIPALPFFCLLLIFIPNQLNWPFIGLSIVSIGQMVIAAASTVLVPDTMIANLSKLGYFGYSNIYNYCLKELLKGNFTQNLGQQLFHLKSWESLIPLFVLLVGFTLFFFREKIKLHNQQQPLQQ